MLLLSRRSGQAGYRAVACRDSESGHSEQMTLGDKKRACQAGFWRRHGLCECDDNRYRAGSTPPLAFVDENACGRSRWARALGRYEHEQFYAP